MVTLVYLFSGFVLALGMVQLVSGIMSIRRRSTWWITGLIGILGIGVGIYLVRHPGVSFQTFILLIGLLLIARGILDLVRVFVDRTSTSGRVAKILTGVIGVSAIIAGVVIMAQPVAGGIAFVWVLGVYAIVFGTLGMALAMELRTALFGEAVEPVTDRDETREKAPARTGSASSRGSRGPRRTGAQPA